MIGGHTRASHYYLADMEYGHYHYIRVTMDCQHALSKLANSYMVVSLQQEFTPL